MSKDIATRSVLTDTIIALANSFKENGFNPPVRIEVDQLTFNKLLAESVGLYNINSKKAITEHEFPLSGITITKYKCPDCNAIFDSVPAHRKHHQAFHSNIKEPEEIKQPAI